MSSNCALCMFGYSLYLEQNRSWYIPVFKTSLNYDALQSSFACAYLMLMPVVQYCQNYS